jgi:hypothetical protein
MKDINFGTLEVLDLLPNYYRPQDGADIPEGLIGAQIVSFGAADPEANLDGGGLIIDYIPKDRTDVMRAVFKFTELGMWMVYRSNRD